VFNPICICHFAIFCDIAYAAFEVISSNETGIEKEIDNMGMCSPKTSFKNMQKAAKSSKFATAPQSKNAFFSRKAKQK
jgi:hypothetical protein